MFGNGIVSTVLSQEKNRRRHEDWGSVFGSYATVLLCHTWIVSVDGEPMSGVWHWSGIRGRTTQGAAS